MASCLTPKHGGGQSGVAIGLFQLPRHEVAGQGRIRAAHSVQRISQNPCRCSPCVPCRAPLADVDS